MSLIEFEKFWDILCVGKYKDENELTISYYKWARKVKYDQELAYYSIGNEDHEVKIAIGNDWTILHYDERYFMFCYYIKDFNISDTENKSIEDIEEEFIEYIIEEGTCSESFEKYIRRIEFNEIIDCKSFLLDNCNSTRLLKELKQGNFNNQQNVKSLKNIVADYIINNNTFFELSKINSTTIPQDLITFLNEEYTKCIKCDTKIFSLDKNDLYCKKCLS